LKPIDDNEGERLEKKKVLEICEILKENFGDQNLGNKSDPTDEYFFLVLSTKTSHKNFEAVFDNLKKTLAKWDNILNVDVSEIEKIIKPCGLYKIKARWIKKAAEKMKSDFGEVTLSPLKKIKKSEVEEYLMSLPGVGIKVAKALMMYSLDYDVLPVDTHTYRVAYRTGIISEKVYLRNERGNLHERLESIIPVGYRRNFHIGAVIVGRNFCFPQNPKCEKCPLKEVCNFKKSLPIHP
jgi:endonuclease-3